MQVCSCCEQSVEVAWLTTRDKPACENCIRFLSDCPYCERAILPGDGETHHLEDLDFSYCYACAETVSQCQACSLPNFDQEAPDYCTRCLQTRAFCIECLQLCRGGYYKTSAGTRCENCQPCRTCNLQGVSLQGGICLACRTSSVTTLQEGLSLYPAAYEFLRDVLGLRLQRIPDLKMSLEPPKANVRTYAQVNPAAKIEGIHSREGWIWVEEGAPEHYSLLILVHELAHAWQQENCPPLSDALLEGFAQWMEYHCALYLNYPEYAQALVERPCPIYGGGLRACLLWEETVGRENFLAEIRQSSDFPARVRDAQL